MPEIHRILLTNSSDIYAGGEFYIFQLALQLRNRGHEVVVVCKPANLLREKCERNSIPVEAVDFPPQGKLFRHVKTLRNLVHRYGSEILHTNTNYDRTAGAFAARLSGIPHVTNVHSFHSLQHNPTHWVRNHWATDSFLVDGECVRDLLVREDGIPPARISVVHLGVDPATMNSDPVSRARVRREFSVSEEDLVVGSVGRLVPFKGQEFLLRAFPEILRHIPTVRLLLVGDGELEKDLRSLARSLDIERAVLFAGFRDDLQAVYSAFDLYCHPSVEGGGETFPFAVLQALAHGLPVVVTRVGDVPVMVEEGGNGHVVPDRNPAALEGAILRLCLNREVRVSMGKQSRLRLLERFTVAKMTDSVEQIYARFRSSNG